MTRYTNLAGNHACAVGAVAAGCRFFAGYPITPSSEIAERISVELPRVGGVFIQMEDEIASMAAVLGASSGGVKSMTATSGPGFSLKQENLGYAAMTETPCVVVNVMRGGPSTGMPTRPAQGDVMQARWGTHGDHPIIVLTPWSVEEVYTETQRAFSLAESLRVPVVVLYDEVIGHLVESVDLDSTELEAASERKTPEPGQENFLPYATTADCVPPMARPGDGYRVHTTGLTHDEDGFPTQNPATVTRVTDRLLNKLQVNREKIERFRCYDCEDAEILVVAYGITARAARSAVQQLRAEGIAAGLFRPQTLWPFPEQKLREMAASCRAVLVPEMNAGQLVYEVERITGSLADVSGLNRYDGESILPSEIVASCRELRHDH